MATTTVDFLFPELRRHVGDDDGTRYTDAWLRAALVSSVNALQRWWGNKYIADTDALTVERNSDYANFTYVEPPVIQYIDERPIVLMASIFIKSGQLEKNSWNVGSWRDAEIAVSTIEGSRAKQFGIKQDWDALQMILKPPQKRLFSGTRTSFPES